MKIFLATWLLEKSQGITLTKLKARKRHPGKEKGTSQIHKDRKMRIYLAGNNAMPEQQKMDIYISKNLIKRRLFSYYETLPGRFARSQFQFIINTLKNEDILCNLGREKR